MILYKKFMNYGRLGNQMFEMLSMLGMAKRLNTECKLPYVELFDFLDNIPMLDRGESMDKHVKEKVFHYIPELFNGSNRLRVDFEGSFQSPKYWNEDQEWAQGVMKFKSSLIKSVTDKIGKVDNAVIMHIRKGDYVGHPGYKFLTPLYYRQIIDKYFKDRNILVFTDDYGYCKEAFYDLDFNYAAEVLNPIESMCAMINCGKDYIVSNSTFSWMGAYLGQSKDSIVIRPKDYFTGRLARYSTDDFWPKDWIVHKTIDKKECFKDVTFIIPVSFDSRDRQKNLELTVFYLMSNFDTNIIIGEQGSGRYFEYMNKYAEYVYFDDIIKFHRTKMLNDMTKMAKTPIVFNWDADVFIPKEQMIKTVNRLRTGHDVVYPYDGRFIRMLRDKWFTIMSRDIEMINGFVGGLRYTTTTSDVSVGGAVAFQKYPYLSIGGENENFISFGREDYERHLRARRMGLKVSRVKGSLYHLDHYVGINSSVKHPNMQGNKDEYRKIAGMSNSELRDYIDTWSWK